MPILSTVAKPGDIIKLDSEGFRLFHQILHIRHISGWSDNNLYQIEQQIKSLTKRTEEEG
jgi:hypothetical protein